MYADFPKISIQMMSTTNDCMKSIETICNRYVDTDRISTRYNYMMDIHIFIVG